MGPIDAPRVPGSQDDSSKTNSGFCQLNNSGFRQSAVRGAKHLPLQARIQRFSKQQRMHARLMQTAQLLRSCGPSVWTKTLNSETGVKPGLTRSMLPTVGGSYTSFTSATPAQTSACTIQRSSTGMRRIATRTSTTTRHCPLICSKER